MFPDEYLCIFSCQMEAFVSVFPWLSAEHIQSHNVLRPIKCEQIYLVHDNEQKLAEQLDGLFMHTPPLKKKKIRKVK